MVAGRPSTPVPAATGIPRAGASAPGALSARPPPVGSRAACYVAPSLRVGRHESVADAARERRTRSARIDRSAPRCRARGTTEGVVESIAAPASKPDADGTGSSIVVPVRISVADQAALAGLALAAVTVSFASTAKNDVLMVPVDALVPTSESEFALELPRTTADDERRLGSPGGGG